MLCFWDECGVKFPRDFRKGVHHLVAQRYNRQRGIPPMFEPRKSIAVLIDTSSSWGSFLIQGVARYAEQHGPWALHLGQHGKHEAQSLPRVERLDGCIARVTNPDLAAALRAARVPTVNVSWSLHGEGHIPTCTSDGAAAGELAARYFLDRGHTQFGYYGLPLSTTHRNDLRASFLATVGRAGHTASVLDAPPLTGYEDTVRFERARDWVLTLEKPAAVLAYDALFGREVTEACCQAGVRVPEDVSVLAGELDELFTSVSVPRLSAIDLAPRRIGFEAAALLGGLMGGAAPPAGPVLIAPAGILTCQSTDTLAIGDAVLREALHFIRARAGDPIQVNDVVRHVAMSRRLLEQRFRVALKRTPAAEIRRVRLERSRLLLEDPGLSIRSVATRSGFEHPEVFARVFRREFGVTPSDYRLRGSPELLSRPTG
jgi:LacI family transcriptional regulator